VTSDRLSARAGSGASSCSGAAGPGSSAATAAASSSARRRNSRCAAVAPGPLLAAAWGLWPLLLLLLLLLLRRRLLLLLLLLLQPLLLPLLAGARPEVAGTAAALLARTEMARRHRCRGQNLPHAGTMGRIEAALLPDALVMAAGSAGIAEMRDGLDWR
jgi:hypothetical protein